MKKSNIYIINHLKPKLFQIPEIVTSLQKKKHSAVDSLCHWMEDTEKQLKELNYTQCAELAGYRAQVIEVKFSDFKFSNERKKKQIQKALEVVYPSQEVLNKIILPLENKITQAKELLIQIVDVAKKMQLIPPLTKGDFTAYIYGIWAVMEQHEQLANGINNVKLLVGKTDGTQLLAETLN